MRLFGSILIAFIFIVGILYPNAIFAQQQNKYLPFAEVMPQPKGGLPAIYKHITYPEIARQSGIQGKEYLLVYVDEKGNVDDVKVIKGLGAGCDQAAINGVKAVKFTPGENNGKPVKVKLSLAITFKLQ
jgi:protein TonB